MSQTNETTEQTKSAPKEAPKQNVKEPKHPEGWAKHARDLGNGTTLYDFR